MPAVNNAASDDPGRPATRSAIRPRRVKFDWEKSPIQWIPGEPVASSVINALHILLPPGERWFVAVFGEVLPRISDPVLRADVKGFMGQEAMHSVQHANVLDVLAENGIDAHPLADDLDRQLAMFGQRPPRGLGMFRGEWLRCRLALIAGIEHFTAVLGDWILRADRLDASGGDPVMLDLLRWHGAEEVEHRSVAFDVYQHFGGIGPIRYFRRALIFVVAIVLLIWCWYFGAVFLLKADPDNPGQKYSLRTHRRAARKGLIPRWRELGVALPRYLKPGFHPSGECPSEAARIYLAGRLS